MYNMYHYDWLNHSHSHNSNNKKRRKQQTKNMCHILSLSLWQAQRLWKFVFKLVCVLMLI